MAKELKSDNMMQTVGAWAFIIGIVIALIAGFFPLGAFMTSVLVVLGLIVGFLNVSGHESQRFLMAAVSMVIVMYFGGQTLGSVEIVGKYISGIVSAIMTFVVPATIIVSIKAIYALAHD
jgi:ATP synthase protein I